jgi:DNA-binding MarR family transcriptional regulator
MYLAVMNGSLRVVEPVDHTPQTMSIPSTTSGAFTALQGQYLAFVHAYTKINRRPPAQADLQRYFEVSPPTVHQMVLKLERLELLQRTPGQARSLLVLVAPEDLPPLR